MKKTIVILTALAMTACTSTRVLSAPDQASAAGIEAGEAITLDMADGRQIEARFVAIEQDELVYDTAEVDGQRAPLSAIDSLSYRAYDSEKTNEAADKTFAVVGAAYIGALITFLIMIDAGF
ncbi:MAG: hypothetical protein HKN84_16510 [Gammaproteobacteria bacterium]|nr:hypothetical protein [Gammaproteobacteria bacterium]